MTECRFKDKDGVCQIFSETQYTFRSYCHDGPCTYEEPLTNGDLVRRKSNEELAEFITDDLCELLCGAPLVCDGQCKQKMLEWLRKEADL